MYSPFWEPTAAVAQSCDAALVSAAAARGRAANFPPAAVQFAGVTRTGAPKVLIHVACPRLVEIHERSHTLDNDLVIPLYFV